MKSSRLRSAFGLCCVSLFVVPPHARAEDETPSLATLHAQAAAGDEAAFVQLGQRYEWGNQGVAQDYEQARAWYEKAAAKGNGYAALQLSQMARTGVGGKKPDTAEAFKWMQKAAESGLTSAQVDLGDLHERGQGTRKNLVEALKWYLKAAELNDTDAQFRVGVAFADGLGTKKDPATAAKWLARAGSDHEHATAKLRELLEANPGLGATLEAQAPDTTKQLLAKAAKGDAAAQFALVDLYAEGGGGLLPDGEASLKWLRAAAASGNRDAQFSLGHRIANGFAAENETGAADWFKKAAAQKHPESLYELGMLYRIGREVEPDPTASLTWFRSAADLGLVQAKKELGEIYLNGWGTPKDLKEAMRWFTDAANQGHTPAMNSIAYIALEPGPAMDPALARKWLTRAVELGDDNAKESLDLMDAAEKEAAFAAQVPADLKPATRKLFLQALRGDAEAQFKLGVHYGFGIEPGIPKNPAEQVKWYRLAADQGNVLAQRNLGQVLMTGDGIPRDDAEGFKWMQRAAEKKDTDACYYLGVLYRYGRGTAKNTAEAAKWLKLAADAGRHDAGMDLAALLLAGDGVEKNEAEAVALLVKAADKKSGQAMWRLSQLYAKGVNGAAPDAAKEREWLGKAGALGWPEAKARLAELATAEKTEKFASLEREFHTAFAAATNTAERERAVVLYSRGMGKLRFSENLTLSQICEKVLVVLLPKMEAHLNEAGEYAISIDSVAFDNATLERVLPAHVQSRIKAHAREVTAAYQRREEALRPIRDLIPKAEAGNLQAQLQIGEGLFGPGPAQDVPGAMRWFQRAADAGYAPARQRLGQIAFDEASTEHKARRLTAAVPGYEKSAGYGNTSAMLALGGLHASGSLPKKDTVAAKAWFEKAIAAGDARGTAMLKLMNTAEAQFTKQQTLEAAIKAYNEKDFVAARAGWEKGAADGDVYSMFNLGTLYENGQGVTRDYVIAKTWYEKALALKHPDAAEALKEIAGYTLGIDELALADKEDEAKNPEKAFEWYVKSAELGNVTAMIVTGGLYLDGKGVDKNPSKAVEWYEKAAAAGDPNASMLAMLAKDSLVMFNLRESEKKMQKLRDDMNGVVRKKAPAIVGAKTGLKDLRKNSPWTTADLLAALKEGADHGALSKAIQQDKTAPEFTDLELKRLLNTPEGRGIETLSPLSSTLHEHSRQGAGAWTVEMAKASVEARRKQVGRAPKIIDTPDLRAKAAAGDAAALFHVVMLPDADRKLGPAPEISTDALRRKLVEANYAPAFYFAADAFRNNPDKSHNDPVKYADYVWKSAEAGDPRGMRELGMLFMAPGETAVVTNYAEAEYWLIEAAARASEGTLEDLYYNPGRDVSFLYSFAKPNGGPASWPLSSADGATMRWARELVRRGGPLADVATVSLEAIEREQGLSGLRAKLDTLPPEIPLWSAAEVAKLDKAAKAGDVAAALKLAEAYGSGRGVRQRDAFAVDYYQLAATKGSVKAMRALAWHHEQGIGVKKDSAQRIAWLEKAGAAGDASAWRAVGNTYQFYNDDKTIGENYPRALAAYEKAITGGDVATFVELAKMHELGRGVPVDLGKVEELLRRGAAAGDTNAQARLARLLSNAKKFAEAATWYGKAADAGDPNMRAQQARMLVKAGDVEAALPLYRIVTAANPEGYQSQMEFGRLLEKRKEFADAAKAYRAVIAVDSELNVYREDAKAGLKFVEAELSKSTSR